MVEGMNAVRRRASVRTSLSRIRRFFNRRNSIFGGVATLIVVFGLLFASAPTTKAYSVSYNWESTSFPTTGGGGQVFEDCSTGTSGRYLFAYGSGWNSGWGVLSRPYAECTDLNQSTVSRPGTAGSWNQIANTSSWGTSVSYNLGYAECRTNEAIVGLEVHSNGTHAAGFRIYCGVLPDGNTRRIVGGGADNRFVYGLDYSGTRTPDLALCPAGMVGMGISAYAGSITDRIGIRCGVISGIPQATVTVTSTMGTFGSPITLQTSGGSGEGAVAYVVTSAETAGCLVSGSSLIAASAGTCTVTATKAADSNYAEASSSATTITFSKADQTITFTNPGTKERSATPFSVAPTGGGSGQPVSISSSTTSVCTTSGLDITMVTTGTCTIVASQSGNGNYNAATDVTRSFTIQDTTPPAVSIAASSASLKSGENSTLTFTLSEASTDFVVGDVTFSGGTLSSFSGSGTSYTVVFTPTANTQSTSGSVSVAADKFTDAAGNNNTASATTTIAYDTQVPSVSSITASRSTLKSWDTSVFTITLSEASTDFVVGDVTFSGGTLSSFTGSGTSYSVVFTPTANTQSGSGSVSVASGAFTDAAGNSNTASSATTITYDTQAPTVSISASATTLKSGETSTLTITLSEASTDFAVGDITFSGGTLSSFTAVSGTSYTVVFTPTANTQSGSGSISVAEDKFTDAAGNNNTASSATTITYDTQAPSVSIAASASTLKSGETSTLTITLSEASSNFATGDVSVTGGTLSSITATSSTVYSVVFTPTANTQSGSGSVSVASGAFTDAAGNNNTASSTTTITYDTQAPSVSIAASASTLKSGETSTLTFTLSEASTDFAVADITFSGGTLSSFTAVSGTSYTVVFTPTANTQSGTGSVSVALGAFTDSAANNNTASSATTITYDTQVATVSSLSVTSSAGSDNTYVAGDSIRVTVNFSEAVTVTGTPTISVLVGSTTRSATYISGSGTSALVFGYTVVAGDTDTDGVSVTVNSLDLGGGTINDSAGNASTLTQVAVAASTSHKVDTTAPTVTIAATSTTLRSSQTSTLTFTLSEASTNFVEGDITFSGGTLSSFTAVSGSSYTVVFTPTANTQSGSGSVSVAADKFTDAAGNNNTASSTTTITYDTQAPSVSIATSASTLKSGETSTLTFTLSEASTNFVEGDITLSGGTLSSFTAVSGTSYTVVFTPTANTQSGTGSVSVAADKFTDAAENNNTASLTTSFTYDTQLPTVSNVTSSSTNGTFTVGDSVSIQVAFNEAVTVSGTPRLTLETGSTDRAVDYVSGSGTTSLTFTYTVQTGDSSSDLDYVSTSSLALNGGSIVDAAGNAATLTLPAPSTTGSLGANKEIVVTSAPTKIVSARTPVGAASGAAFTTQPQVSLQDSGSNVVTNDSATVVTATVSDGATLVGTRTATASNGVATFSDLGISGTAGTAYTITYSASYGGSALTVATQSVTPTVGAATQIAITTQPVGATAGALLATQPVIKVLDSGSNVVTTASASIEVSASGGTLGGTTTVSTSSGVATFTNLTFAGTATTNYTLTFAATGYTSQTSSSFSVGVGAATKLVLTTSAATAKYGQAFATQPVVKVQDAGSNLVTASSAVVTASLSSGTVVGTGNATSSSGVATFSGLGITGVPGSYTVTYSSGSLTTASQVITVSKADQTVTLEDPADRAWLAETFVLSPTASSGLGVTLTSSTTSVCTVSTLTVTMLREGTCTLTAAQSGNENYNAASSVTQSFIISFATQATLSVSSSPTITYGSTMTLTTSGGSSTGAVSYGVTGDCSISGSTLTATGDATATCAVTATKDGDSQYSQATATQTVTIAKSPSNTITFASLENRSWSSSIFAVLPTSTSGDTPVIASTTTDVCTVSSLTVTMVSSGTCSLTASEDGNRNYLAATDVVRSFEISRVTPSASTWTDVTATNGDVDQLISPPTVLYGGVTVVGSWSYSSADTSVVAISSATMRFGSVGATTITGSFTPTDLGKYNGTVATLNVSVGKIRPQFTWGNVSKTFGDTTFSLTPPTVTNSVAGTWSYSSQTTSVVSLASSTATVAGAGSSLITATFTPTDATNYVSGGTVAMTVTVEKATPTFGWTGVTAIFGDANSAITAPTVATTAATGTWAYSSATTSVVTISGSDLDFGNAGTSLITATFTPSNTTNYVSGGTVTMTVTVNQADQAALSIASTNGTYGTALTLSTSGGTTGGTVSWSVVDGTAISCSVSSGELSASTVGTCGVTATMAGDTNYKSVVSLPTTVTFGQRRITVTAADKNKTYGENDPSFTYSITSGSLVGSDALSGSLTRSAGAGAGTYSITQGSLANSNYAITFVQGALTIDRKLVTVTAADTTKQYGDVDPTLTYSITNGATLVGDDAFTGALSRASGSNVGTYAIQQGTLTLSNNYLITFVSGTLTIEMRSVTITADAKSKQYGQADPALTYQVTTGSLIVGDSISGALARNSGSGVGSYTITQGSLSLSANYNLTFVSANLSVTAKPITITANSLQTKVYGESDPTFQYEITNGSLESGDSLSGSLSRSSGSTVGTYALNIGTLANSNYEISFVSANFAITRKPITITASAKTKVYDQADPSLVFTVTSGSLVGSDSLSGSLSRVSGENVGTYAITKGSVANSNYDISYVGADLTIERASQNALSLTTSQITYGTSVVLGSNGGSGTGAVTYSVSSAGTAGCSIAGDTLSATGDVGTTCTVTVTKALSANYNVATSSAATITVINRSITVTATSARKNYGDADPELAYTITSGALVAGDTLTGALNRASGESVGTHSITQGTLANANYTITYVGANLTIDRRPITVRAANKTKVFGQTDPSLTYEITSGNLIGSDNLTGSISRNSGENVGSYAIGRGSLVNNSYEITFVEATLTIAGADQSGFTLSAASTSIVYGESTTLSTSGGNGNGAVTYAVTGGTGGCTITDVTITSVSAGTCVVTATKAQEGNFNSATSNDLTINVARRSQTTSFTQPANRNFTTASFSLAPTVDSGNSVTLASQTTNVCTVSGLSVSLHDSGTCTLVASVGATSNYNAAADVTRSFEISSVVPSAPILNSLTASDAAISVSFTLGNSGGSPLLNHEYSLNNGTTWSAWPAGSITSPLNIAGLRNGTEYQVVVRAKNAVGHSDASNMLAVTPIAPVVIPSLPAQNAAGPNSATTSPTQTVPEQSTTTSVSSSTTTTIFVVTTVTANPAGSLPTTTVSRRAVTTTTAQRNGQITTTTTTRVRTTTTSLTTTTVKNRLPDSSQIPPLSTVQTQTTVFQSIEPLAPSVTVSDTVPPSLAPSKSAAVVDGVSATLEVRVVNDEQVVATVGESTLALMSLGDNGAPEPLLPNGSIAVNAGGKIRVNGKGMMPADPIEIWIYSTPVKLGEVVVSADGSFSGEFVLPSGIALGSHKIQFVGKRIDGAEMIFAQGISVVDEMALTLNRAGALDSARADNLAKPNVSSISNMREEAAANVILWFLVIMIFIAGLIAIQPRRTVVALSPKERLEAVTPWLAGMELPRVLMMLVGALVGFGAANSTSFSVTAPSTLWISTLIIVGLLDVMAGGIAGFVFTVSMIVNGSVGSMLDVRIATLIILLATLPSIFARAAIPIGANKGIQEFSFVFYGVIVVVAISLLFAPVGGVNYEFTNSLIELSWLAALASLGRIVLLRLTKSSDEQIGVRMPALRVVGVFLAAAFIVNTGFATVWTYLAIFVLAVVVFFGLPTRFEFSVRHIRTMFFSAIVVAIVSVVAATGTFTSRDSNDQLTETTSAKQLSRLSVIGKLDVLINGYPQTFLAMNTGVGEVTFINSSIGQSLTIESKTQKNERVPLRPDNTLHLIRGEKITIRANGYAPNEIMDAWLFSNPVLIGNSPTNSEGKLETSFVVPISKNEGMHTLEIRLIGLDRSVVNYSIPVMLSSRVPKVEA
jgi:large repetitive protein